MRERLGEGFLLHYEKKKKRNEAQTRSKTRVHRLLRRLFEDGSLICATAVKAGQTVAASSKAQHAQIYILGSTSS